MPWSWPNLRASLIAASLASQPELQKNTLSMPESSHSLAASVLLQRHVVIVGAVDQLADLVGERGREHRVGVPERVDGDAGQRVEVALALGVPEPQPRPCENATGRRP